MLHRLGSILLVLLAACQPAAESAPPTPQAPPSTAAVPTDPQTAATVDKSAPARLAGRVAYPSEELPAMRVCAVDSSDSGSAVCVRTAVNQPHYEIDVPAGQWWLLAWPQDTGTAGDPGLLSDASECLGSGGLGCDQHALLAVTVAAGEVREGLDINDWYYAPGEFPPPMEPRDDEH